MHESEECVNRCDRGICRNNEPKYNFLFYETCIKLEKRFLKLNLNWNSTIESNIFSKWCPVDANNFWNICRSKSELWNMQRAIRVSKVRKFWADLNSEFCLQLEASHITQLSTVFFTITTNLKRTYCDIISYLLIWCWRFSFTAIHATTDSLYYRSFWQETSVLWILI